MPNLSEMDFKTEGYHHKSCRLDVQSFLERNILVKTGIAKLALLLKSQFHLFTREKIKIKNTKPTNKIFT